MRSKWDSQTKGDAGNLLRYSMPQICANRRRSSATPASSLINSVSAAHGFEGLTTQKWVVLWDGSSEFDTLAIVFFCVTDAATVWHAHLIGIHCFCCHD
jgi:hypothetical protein